MNYSLNVKSSSIVHTLLSNCVKLLGKVQKLLIKCISYSVISKQIRVVSPKFYTARKNFTGPPVPGSRQISSLEMSSAEKASCGPNQSIFCRSIFSCLVRKTKRYFAYWPCFGMPDDIVLEAYKRRSVAKSSCDRILVSGLSRRHIDWRWTE